MFGTRQKNNFGGIFAFFPQNGEFSKKFRKILQATFEKNHLLTY